MPLPWACHGLPRYDAGMGIVSRITAVSVICTIDTPDGPQQAIVDVAELRVHCRPERVEDLLEDLVMLCQDVQDRRHPEDSGRPVLAVIRGHK
jgi:hypothetical protein